MAPSRRTGLLPRPPHGLERLDGAAAASEQPRLQETPIHRRLPLSAWERLFAQQDIVPLADCLARERSVAAQSTGIAGPPDVLGIALRNLAGVAGAVALQLPPAGAEREEEIAFVRILGECATAALQRIESLAREREARACVAQMEREQEWQREEIHRAEAQKKQFYRDILCAVTNGKLTLCDREELDQYWAGPCVCQPVQDESDVRRVRQAVSEAGLSVGLPDERVQDLCLCASEAATNALKHAGSGEASLTVTPSAIRVRVEDRGSGIDPFHLPRATLMKGYSTRASLGLGFTLMHELADHLYLTTNGDGTTLILEVVLQPVSELEQMLARLSVAD